MNTHTPYFPDGFKNELVVLLSIVFGIFLFVLFFQPFPLDKFDFNDKLIFVAGLSGIVFFWMVVMRASLGLFIHKNQDNPESDSTIYTYSALILLILSSTSFAFYIRYVAHIHISFHIMFKIVLLCLSAPIILNLFDRMAKLELQNKSLAEEKESLIEDLERYKQTYLNQSIALVSENNAERFDLAISEIALIKSADNYVEVIYTQNDQLKKKLIRNTLNHIEQQLKPYVYFVRCHRICIVNTYFIESLNRQKNNHWLTLKGYAEQVPVSRQYVLRLKDSISY